MIQGCPTVPESTETNFQFYKYNDCGVKLLNAQLSTEKRKRVQEYIRYMVKNQKNEAMPCRQIMVIGLSGVQFGL